MEQIITLFYNKKKKKLAPFLLPTFDMRWCLIVYIYFKGSHFLIHNSGWDSKASSHLSHC